MTEYLEIILGLTLLGIGAICAFYYYYKKAKDNNHNEYLFDMIPNLFPTFGMFFTFLGIAIGLWNFDSLNIEASIPELLNGLKTAFIVSMGGIFLLLVFSMVHGLRKKKIKYESDETLAIKELNASVKELLMDVINSNKEALENVTREIAGVSQEVADLKKSFVSLDESGNQLLPGNLLRDLYKINENQSESLEGFTSELGDNISSGFRQILNNPTEGVVAELKLVQNAIVDLSNKMKDPATDMTQSIVKDLQQSMSSMIEEFKNSVSGDTKNEMEQLAKVLSQAGIALTNFPGTMEVLTNNLNENFKGIQEVVQRVSSTTLSESERTVTDMRRQIEDMANILKSRVGDLQTGQESLLNEQTKNLEISDSLLNAFNVSVDKMNNLSLEINNNISYLNKSHNALENLTQGFKLASNDIAQGSKELNAAQSTFKKYSSDVLDKNAMSVLEFNNSLEKASKVSLDYTNNFKIIEDGLEGIFEQINIGLKDYTKVVEDSLQKYLSSYSESLTGATSSLSNSLSHQSEIMEEMSEMLSELKK